MHRPADYFERFLAGYMHRPLLDGYDGLSAAFVVAFRDTGDAWRVTLERGRIAEVRRAAPDDDPPVRYDVDLPVFAEMVAGATSPQAAFFARRTAIHGNLLVGLKLARILGEFFGRHPFAEA